MLCVQPIDVTEACEFVARHHRHHRPPQGYKLCVAVNDGEKVVGVLIAGRPVARMLDNGTTLEVTRCCTDGTRNACSMLYAHAWKAARALGYTRLITYTLPEEGGASLKAAGMKCVGESGGGAWVHSGKVRRNDHPLCPKWRWEFDTGTGAVRMRVTKPAVERVGLFDNLGDDDEHCS